MGNRASRLCRMCFSRARGRKAATNKVPRTVSETSEGAASTDHDSLDVPINANEPLLAGEKVEETIDTRRSFDLEAISRTLDLKLAELMTVLATPPSDDPTLELLLHTDDFHIYGKFTSHGLFLTTTWTVPYPPDVYQTFIKDFDGRKLWDRNVEECRKVCYLNEDISVNYQRYRKVMVVARRELLVACRSVQSGEDVIDVSCSVDSEDFPLSPDIVRAHLHLGGYRLRPCTGGTSITAISEMDLGTSVPRPVLKRLSALGLLLFTKALAAALARTVGNS